jgi:hypothetical protein
MARGAQAENELRETRERARSCVPTPGNLASFCTHHAVAVLVLPVCVVWALLCVVVAFALISSSFTSLHGAVEIRWSLAACFAATVPVPLLRTCPCIILHCCGGVGHCMNMHRKVI